MNRSLLSRAFGRPHEAIRAVIVLVVVTAVIGGLTSLGQQYLPDSLRSLANSAGPWLMTVLVALYVGRPRLVLAIILGVIGFWVLVVAYDLVNGWRGYSGAGGITGIWGVAAIVVGPVVGIAATWLRSRRKYLVAIGVAAPAAVLVGEGVYGLTAVLATTGPVVWIIELVVGVALLAVIAAGRIRSPRPILLAIGLSAVGAAAFDVVFRAL